MTEWRSVVGWEGLYEVSDEGRVRRAGAAKMLKPWLNSKGYPVVKLSDTKTERVRNVLVHRQVALAFTPNPQGLPEVNHLDGNKLNARDWNLEWATYESNRQHAYENGLAFVAHGPEYRGENHRLAKLTESDVMEARRAHAAGEAGFRVLARRYGVSKKTMREAITGVNWSHAECTCCECLDKIAESAP